MLENKLSFGQIKISDEVVAKIASTSALEVEGVSAAVGKASSGIVELFGVKNQSKVAKVTTENGETTIDLEIAVNVGSRIHETAKEAQERVKTAVETMTGLKVLSVNVNVASLMLEREKSKDDQAGEGSF